MPRKSAAKFYDPEWQELLNVLDVSGPTVQQYHDALEEMIEELEARRDAAKEDLRRQK